MGNSCLDYLHHHDKELGFWPLYDHGSLYDGHLGQEEEGHATRNRQERRTNLRKSQEEESARARTLLI